MIDKIGWAHFLRTRSPSLSMVVLVLLVTAIVQGGISYSTTFGALDRFTPIAEHHATLSSVWLALRALLVIALLLLWTMNRKRRLFRTIIIVNSIFTLSLILNMVTLITALPRLSPKAISALLLDVFLMAVSNILIFSIWYWIIDPPGVEEAQRVDVPWDFLFPQRAAVLPHYESWEPRYTDYLYLAFTTSFAFSPTDTLPLTRRAKALMLLQSTISIITLTGIAGGAINLLAGSN